MKTNFIYLLDSVKCRVISTGLILDTNPCKYLQDIQNDSWFDKLSDKDFSTVAEIIRE